jgi:thiosulfate/3-mercaptopyruvate sulfurtransferase
MKRFTGFIVVWFAALVLLSSVFVSGSRADEFVSGSEGNEFISERGAASTAPSAQFSKYFVTTKWVKGHLNGAVIIDTRDSTAYAAGHIKGAINVPMGNYIFSRVEGTDGTQILYMIPTPAEFIKLVNSWGIKNSNTVVVTYGGADDADWGVSARLAWTLQLFGHKKAYNMDGGFPKWQYEYAKYSVTDAKVPTPNTKTYALSSYSDILATKYDVLSVVEVTDTGSVLLDTRTSGEYSGDITATATNPRSGHIPNAVFLDWATDVFTDYTIPGTTHVVKVLKSEADLRTLFTGLGVTKDKTIIPYCEGGFRSAHVTFLLLGLGYPSVRHYQGSWSEWSRQDPAVYLYRTGSTP